MFGNLDTEICCNAKNRDVSPTLPEKNDSVRMNVLVVYTPAAKQWATQNGYNIDSLIEGAMQRSNLVFSNSLTGVTLNLAYIQEVNYIEGTNPNNDLSILRNPEDGKIDEIHALRTQYDADLVTLLLGDKATNGVLGAGYIPNSEWGNAKSAFSVVQIKTLPSGFTFPHELGHNFGCGHHIDVDAIALYSYSHGHRGISNQSTKFSTVMTYETTTGTLYPHLPYFSDPNIDFEGVQVGTTNSNNAKTIRQFKSVVAAYSEEAKWIDAFLKTINISEGILIPAFNPGIYNYTVNVDNNVQNIDIEGIANSPYVHSISGNQTAMPLNVGDNVVEIKVEDGWQNYEKTYTVNIIRASASANVNEVNDNLIEIYPNPAISELKINSGKLKINSVEILDITGKSIINHIKNVNSIDVSHLSQGVYLIKIHSDKNTVTKRWIKEF